ncbi:MAG: magnesium chelatase, partial [Crocinitomicaceae bacterium]|nr:magnesium chelatase [Crocinitomicaceae bacterium]
KLRLIETGLDTTSVRLVDFISIIPSITGKIELVYEGEQEGADEVARLLIDNAIMKQFEKLFPRIPKLDKEGIKTPYTDTIEWFSDNFLELNYSDEDADFKANLMLVKPLIELVDEYCSTFDDSDKMFCMELVLWCLTVSNKLDKTENNQAFKFDSVGIDSQFFGNN